MQPGHNKVIATAYKLWPDNARTAMDLVYHAYTRQRTSRTFTKFLRFRALFLLHVIRVFYILYYFVSFNN